MSQAIPISTAEQADIHAHRVLILDFGGQYTQLIARRVRECGVYSEIHPWDMSEEEISNFKPSGVVLSGGPESVNIDNPPHVSQAVFELGVPVLGICYGMQAMAAQLGGKVAASAHREFGYAEITPLDSELLAGFSDAPKNSAPHLKVWMSHGDRVEAIPPGFVISGKSKNSPLAAMEDRERRYYGVQFHPEVTHTPQGQSIINRFVRDICACPGDWTPGNIVSDAIAQVRDNVGDDKVLLGLSGGVDSSVVAALLHEAIGDQLTCVFVDHGLLRYHEGDQVMDTFAEHLGVNVIRVDAADRFFDALAGVSDPEEKRKIIGGKKSACHQVAPQRWWATAAHAHATGRAIARTVQGRSPQDRSGTRLAAGHGFSSPVPRSGTRRSRTRRSKARICRVTSAGRQYIHRRAKKKRPVRHDESGIRRVFAGSIRWCDGRWAPIRLCRSTSCRRNHRLHDGAMGETAI
jgi:GMP synthase (glutamine-hydrolysing) A subunit